MAALAARRKTLSNDHNVLAGGAGKPPTAAASGVAKRLSLMPTKSAAPAAAAGASAGARGVDHKHAAPRPSLPGGFAVAAAPAPAPKTAAAPRPSLGGGALSRQSLGGRPSLGGSNARPLSIGGRMSLGGAAAADARKSMARFESKVADARPLKDKNFQREAIEKLIVYLTTHGFDAQLTLKQLNPPTNKDFRRVVEFLVRQFDPNHQWRDHFEEEVVAWFKCVRYPVALSAKNMSAVGSPHTWPSLLGALVWLVEALKVNEQQMEQDAQRAAATAQGGDAKKAPAKDDWGMGGGAGGAGAASDPDEINFVEFFEYLAPTYRRWMEGEDIAVLEQNMRDTFAQRNEQVNRAVEKLKAAEAPLKEEEKKLTEMANTLIEANKGKARKAEDVKQYEKALEVMNSYHAQRKQMVAKLTQELEQKANEAKQQAYEVEALQRQVAAQPVSSDEAQALGTERQRLDAALEQLSRQRGERQQQVWVLECDVAKRVEALELEVRDYNDWATKLELTPADAKHAAEAGRDLALTLNAQLLEQAVGGASSAATAELSARIGGRTPSKGAAGAGAGAGAWDAKALISPDLRKVVSPALAKLKTKCMAQCTELSAELLRVKESAKRQAEAERDGAEAVRAHSERLQKTEAKLQAERADKNAALQEMLRRIEDVELESARLNAAPAADLPSAALRLATEQAVARLRERLERERDSAVSEIKQTIELVIEHKSKMALFAAHIADRHAKARAMVAGHALPPAPAGAAGAAGAAAAPDAAADATAHAAAADA